MTGSQGDFVSHFGLKPPRITDILIRVQRRVRDEDEPMVARSHENNEMVPQDAMTEVPGANAAFRAARWRVLFARFLEILVGGVFLLAGVLKAFGPLEFAREISDYGIITVAAVVKPLAWLFIAIECIVGAGLIAGFARRILVPVSGGLLVLFIGAVGWAWHTGATENCGCFGSWAQRTPAQALIEDVVLLAAVLGALLLDRRELIRFRALRLAFVVVALASGIGIAAYSSGAPALQQPATRDGQSRPPGPFTGLAVTGIAIDLEEGERIVMLIDIGCEHCQKGVPEVNRLAADPEKRVLTALCFNTPEQVEWFKKEFGAQFPIGRVDRKDFLRLLDLGKTPRTFLVRDGAVLKIWDEQIPTEAELSELGAK
jgi:hypothetical protein